MIEVYSLTSYGHALAQSTNNPDTLAWRIVHFLDRMGTKDTSTIAMHCGGSEGEVTSTLRELRHRAKPVVIRES